ncbi:MAG: insulinase family protein [Methylobacteriaceae bacterium]|jgi:zinc protease|nr:insulinase family protein [Methylobacteriaceae bacterium]
MATPTPEASPAPVTQPASASGTPAPHVAHFSLENGLEVVVIPDHRVAVATHMVWYRNGSADDPIGHSGIAHFLEHLMFKGTVKHPAGEFSQVVASLGGQENAFTSYDFTAYFQRVPKQHLAVMMEFESDRMHNLRLTDDVIGAERDVVMEERRMRTDSDPSSQLSESMMAALYLHHPYGIPVIGWMHEIETLSRADAEAYYQRFYTPENAVLVVAGDVEADEVRAMAAETYGKIPARGARPVRSRPLEPPPRTARRLTLADPKVEQPALHRLYLVPCYKRDWAQSVALDVLSETLGGGLTSYLYRRLVVDKKVAVATGAWQMSEGMEDGNFALYASPVPEVSLEELEKELDAALKEAPDLAFNAAALERARTRLIAQMLYARDSQQSMANNYGRTLAVDLPLETVNLWPVQIEAVTAAEVSAALARWLTPERSVTGYLLKT